LDYQPEQIGRRDEVQAYIARTESAREQAMSQPCACCRRRRGLHRWGDEACPDPRWRPGNGMSQFLAAATFRSRLS
jgi:hypothetical protein